MSLTRMIGYKHTQDVASTTWTINHNLGANAPCVDIWVDVGGTLTKIIPESVVVTSPAVTTITFSSAYAGEAYIA